MTMTAGFGKITNIKFGSMPEFLLDIEETKRENLGKCSWLNLETATEIRMTYPRRKYDRSLECL